MIDITLSGHSDWGNAVAISPDGKWGRNTFWCPKSP